MGNHLQLLTPQHDSIAGAGNNEFVTMRVADQLFGIPVLAVQDVLRGLKVTKVPLASAEIAGALNLRGRIVTALHLALCLGLPMAESLNYKQVMSVVVEYKNELFSLIVDSVGEVANLPVDQMEKNPANLSPNWKEVASGVYKLQNELLVILDVQKLFKSRGIA